MIVSAMKIEARLAELGLTKAALAERCGVSRQSISIVVRRGTCEPRTAGKLAKGLGVELAAILEGGTEV